MYVELSHRLSANTPLPTGVPPVKITHHSSLDRGDGSNLFVLHFSNHTGTHIDAPWHFVPSGLRITDFALDEFVFHHPLCLDVPLGDGQMIEAKDLLPLAGRIAECDLLLIRTGYTRVRQTEPERYAFFSPGMSAKGASYLAQNFPQLRALGLDTISLASMQHLAEGLEAHRILLGGKGRRFLIVEDMNLDWDLSQLRLVMAVPLFVEGVDSAPCTVLGVVE